jgi:hypothetical protein
VAVVLALQYVHFALPVMQRTESRRPAAAQLNARVPKEETLYVFKPQYQSFLFYVREPLEYLIEPAQIDMHVRFLLMREDAYQGLKDQPTLALRLPKLLCTVAGRKFDFHLLELTPAVTPGKAGGDG